MNQLTHFKNKIIAIGQFSRFNETIKMVKNGGFMPTDNESSDTIDFNKRCYNKY